MNVNVLLKNIEANRFEPDFQLFPIALSDHLGALPLFGANTGASLVEGWAGQTNSTLVPISTFDKTAGALVQGKSCLVLIDVEGAELGCLKGASSLLSANTKNVLLIEISVNEHQPSGIQINPNLVETFELMFSNDFKAFTVDAEFRQVELAEVVQIAETGMDSIGTHNFLFVKSDMSLDELGLPA